MTVKFKEMQVNQIYLNLSKDECFIIMKVGRQYHKVFYESGGLLQELSKERMDLIAVPSKMAEKNARKILYKALEKRADRKDNVFGNLYINLEPILNMTIREIINFYPPDYDEREDGRKKIIKNWLIPYTGFQAPMWRVFRHYQLHGKTEEEWLDHRKHNIPGSRPKDKRTEHDSKYKRSKDRAYWNRMDYLNHIKDFEYTINDADRKSCRALKKAVDQIEAQKDKQFSTVKDLNKGLKNKKKDKKSKKKRKLINAKYIK